MTTRWVATYEPNGKGWRARPELYRATTLVHHLTCKHRHTSQKAAIACARKLVGDDSIPDRLEL
jgi:hypothetical protein